MENEQVMVDPVCSLEGRTLSMETPKARAVVVFTSQGQLRMFQRLMETWTDGDKNHDTESPHKSG